MLPTLYRLASILGPLCLGRNSLTAYTRPVAKPDATKYDPNPKYLRKLVDSSGLSQRQCAATIGVDERTMRAWLAGDRAFSYPIQYAMEQLAKGK